ncbi:glycoside hydrolase family 38 N-terminal domain-containing protein [Draconibacterium sediminis]|uniref:glycoside hydrolase family 38 N-terminal domain-containing protein n=1 Tax=Draconibacterium sediminis TaxID=1544798 RepID=UPI000696D9AE|nr:glycosyl hydrolase-related protein [Draconibacterium sediminis]
MRQYHQILFNILFIVFCFNATGQERLEVDNETFDILKKASESALANGSILLSLTTHQDLAWADEISKCVIWRDEQWISPFMERLEKERGFEMDIEQTSIIQEYIERHPEKKQEITKRLKEGRMLIGSTYTQPYEEMYFSESLARQFYLGKLWLKNEFDGYNATSYYNSDVPGRSLQMPQLMAKAGVDNMFISRHERGVFDWLSPDGSAVTTYSPGHYIDFYNILGKENDEAVKELAKQVLVWTDGYNDIESEEAVMPAVLNFEPIWDMGPVENLDPFLTLWNNLTEVENEDGEILNVQLPAIRFSTLDKFFKQIRKSSKEIPSIMGERPNVWIYIHGPSHHWAMDHSRKADILLPAAEKFATVNALVDGSYSKYPIDLFWQAWESKIYPDHGWGGKGGVSTDNIFLQRFADAHEKSKQLLGKEIETLASKVKISEDKGIPVMVFNSLNWNRTSPVVCKMNFDPQSAKSVKLFSKEGKEVAVQLENVKADKDGFLKSAEINFIAEDVPSVGFDTYYIQPSKQGLDEVDKTVESTFENDFFVAELGNGGISSMFDKQLNKELINSEFFKAGEIFTMKSEGNGAGEFDAVQQPTMEGFDKTGNYQTKWEIIANGKVFKTFKFRQPIRNSVAEVEVTFYNQIKKVDFDVAVKNFDGTMYREYRMALPLKMENNTVSYEVPYGVVEVGKDEMPGAAGERYYTPCNELHPRGIENWINASGDGFGVTLASSVVGMDYLDPTGNGLKGTILQPILLASRKSCHWEGNEYHQTGHHHFNFSITSHDEGWKHTGLRFGKESNEPVFAVVAPIQYADASLNESECFLKVDNDNIIVTAMKKAENEEGVAIRFYNLEDNDLKVKFQLFDKFNQAYRTNLIEEVEAELKLKGKDLELNVGKFEIGTVKLKKSK